jgi:thiamine phosphate synthase YjbQ (UPF0047 family)
MHISASVFVNDHEVRPLARHPALAGTHDRAWSPDRYKHNDTGEDNAAAHLRSLTVGHEVVVPVTRASSTSDHGSGCSTGVGRQRKKRVIIKVMGRSRGRHAARSGGHDRPRLSGFPRCLA